MRGRRLTRQDNEHGDGDGDGVVDVAHDAADYGAAAEEEDERRLVDRLCEFKQEGLWVGGQPRTCYKTGDIPGVETENSL